MMIMRTNTPLASTNCSLGSRFLYVRPIRVDSEEQVFALAMVCLHCLGDLFHPLKRNTTISQVMERSCLEHEMAQQRSPSALVGRHYVKLPPPAVSIHWYPTLVQQFVHTVWVSLRREKSAWENSCTETIPVTELHPVLATAARMGCQGQGELNGTSTSSLS